MQRFVGTLGWSMAFLALASCSNGSRGPQGGAGGSVAGTGGAANPGTGGTVAPPGTGGTTGTGGASGGTGGNVGGGAGGQTVDAGGDATGDAGDGWTPLFNGRDLTGWTPSPGAAALYAVDTFMGEPVIHVYPTQADQSNQPQATLRTNQSYTSYIFHEEYRWGTKRFADRSQTDRDNGICFHICNDPNQVWPESIEFQLGDQAWPGDWVPGHIFMLVSRTRAQWTYTMLNGFQVYSPTGISRSIGAPASYFKGMTDKERNLPNAWNVVELTVHANRDATYTVNGEVANGLTNMECQINGVWTPLDHGPIALQAEFAEVYFRNIKIKILP